MSQFCLHDPAENSKSYQKVCLSVCSRQHKFNREIRYQRWPHKTELTSHADDKASRQLTQSQDHPPAPVWSVDFQRWTMGWDIPFVAACLSPPSTASPLRKPTFSGSLLIQPVLRVNACNIINWQIRQRNRKEQRMTCCHKSCNRACSCSVIHTGQMLQINN